MIRRLLRKLRADKRGVAVAEFAIWIALFFMGTMAALDFGEYYIRRGQVSDALAAVTVDAFQRRDSVGFANIQTDVRNLAGNQALTVTAACNGAVGACANSGRTCACLGPSGTFVAAASCGAGCTSNGMTANSTSGYYLTVTASQPFQPVLLPAGVLGGSTIRQRATVRLQ